MISSFNFLADSELVILSSFLGPPPSLEEIEKEAILATLSATDGNKSESARRLGITRKTLHNKLKSYGIG
jgi:two-component system, NtrC family, response regulator HydG